MERIDLDKIDMTKHTLHGYVHLWSFGDGMDRSWFKAMRGDEAGVETWTWDSGLRMPEEMTDWLNRPKGRPAYVNVVTRKDTGRVVAIEAARGKDRNPVDLDYSGTVCEETTEEMDRIAWCQMTGNNYHHWFKRQE